MILAFHKPYNVLSQFTPEEGSPCDTLASFGFPKGVYPIGRLDADSEGLLLLSDEPRWNSLLLHPKRHVAKVYAAQVEGSITGEALKKLESGTIVIKGHRCLPAKADSISCPAIIGERVPPIRQRVNIPTSWVALSLHEGKNRQVRRMTAAVGFPTLRLVRLQVGAVRLDVPVGEFRRLSQSEVADMLSLTKT